MNTPSAELIGLARAAIGAMKDSELAALVDGASDSTLSTWRLGRVPMPDHQAMKLAEIAGADPLYWLAMVNADKARRNDTREAWRAMAERLQSTP